MILMLQTDREAQNESSSPWIIPTLANRRALAAEFPRTDAGPTTGRERSRNSLDRRARCGGNHSTDHGAGNVQPGTRIIAPGSRSTRAPPTTSFAGSPEPAAE